MDHLNVLGHAELTSKGRDQVGEDSSGPFRIVEVDHAWGIGILDSHDTLHWIMKGAYTILDMKSISTPHTSIDRIIKSMDGKCDVEKVKRWDGQFGHVHDVHIESKLDHILLSLSNHERSLLAQKLNGLDE